MFRNSLLIPNPGGNHSFWADLFFRNAIKYVVAGSMGPTARAIMTGHGIQPVLGIKGPIDDVIRRFVAGELTPVATDAVRRGARRLVLRVQGLTRAGWTTGSTLPIARSSSDIPATRRRPGWTSCGRRLRAPRPAGPGLLDYTGGGLYCDVAGPAAPRVAAGRRVRQPALDNPDVAGGAALVADAAPRCSHSSTPTRRVRRHFHAQRERGAEAGRRVVSVPARRALPPHVRQPQLGERHPRVRPPPGRDVRYLPVDAPSCASTAEAVAAEL